MRNLSQKPVWLRKRFRLSDCGRVKTLLRGLNLHTVCEEAMCPNMGECFHKNTAAFMILGNICTRDCRFCGVTKGEPLSPDDAEPKNIARAVKAMGLNYVVVTSVTRDDLEDKGAGQFIDTVAEIRKTSPETKVELLIPDFNADEKLIEKVVHIKPDVINHNIETVKRLYPDIRSKASYQRSLQVLRIIKGIDSSMRTKSGFMLGLGETDEEAKELMQDLRNVSCDFLSIGQYLQPSRRHYPVQEFVSPEKFENYRLFALNLGFSAVKSSPYTRSSYQADEYVTHLSPTR
jgi:lipoic acid synthetase